LKEVKKKQVSIPDFDPVSVDLSYEVVLNLDWSFCQSTRMCCPCPTTAVGDLPRTCKTKYYFRGWNVQKIKKVSKEIFSVSFITKHSWTKITSVLFLF